jgi:hypothetical protein
MSMTTFPLIDCCEMLAIDPKTLRHWLRQATLLLHAHPTDARVKCLTMEQVQYLATLHGRILQPHEALAHASLGETSVPLVPQTPTHPDMARDGIQGKTIPTPLPTEGDLVPKLSRLETQVAMLQEQLAQLTVSLLLSQGDRSDHPLGALSALAQPIAEHRLSPQVYQQTAAASGRDAGRTPHPAESRRRPLLPLIEYGTGGSYVVICPQEGELDITPDSPEWFAWLVSLSSFRFVGKHGRFTACRVYDKGGPTRSWQAHRVIHQRHYKPYLGVTERLTIDCLEQAAATLQSYVEPR